jgi:hypothetical protein
MQQFTPELEYMSDTAFTRWVASAQADDIVVYACVPIGFLAAVQINAKKPIGPELAALAAATAKAGNDALVTFTQRKIPRPGGHNIFEYRAHKLSASRTAQELRRRAERVRVAGAGAPGRKA